MSKEKETSGFFSLKRMFHFPLLSTKDVCILGLLIAITIVLSAISGNLRIGNFSKLSISFVTVFIAAYCYGGLAGGLVAALADIISCFVNPVGPFILQLTVIEFIFGFIYGIFFYQINPKRYILNVVVCDVIQLITNILLKTAVLATTFNSTFSAYFIARLPVCLIQTGIILIVLILLKPFLKSFKISI